MADTRLPDRWLIDKPMRKLTDRQWRIFTVALMYCNHELTDGAFELDDIVMLRPEATDDEMQVFVDLGLMQRTQDGYQFLRWDEKYGLGQTSREKYEGYLDKKKHNQKAYRDRKKREAQFTEAIGNEDSHVTGNVTDHVGGDVGIGIGIGIGTGLGEGNYESRSSENENEELLNDADNNSDVSWPVTEIPRDLEDDLDGARYDASTGEVFDEGRGESPDPSARVSNVTSDLKSDVEDPLQNPHRLRALQRAGITTNTSVALDGGVF